MLALNSNEFNSNIGTEMPKLKQSSTQAKRCRSKEKIPISDSKNKRKTLPVAKKLN